MNDIRTFDSRNALISELVSFVADRLTAAITSKGRASLAVPGGTTPAPFFEQLRKQDLDWGKISVMLTDERFVPETSERSNTRLLREHLLIEKAAAAPYVSFYKSAQRPEDVLLDIQNGVAPHLPLDVCLLGMGADMHTASIFPGADRLDEALSDDAPNVLPMRAAGAPEPRLTLTAPVLRAAKDSVILLMGQGKWEPLQTALQHGPVADAPVRVVLQNGNPTTVFYAE